VREPIHIDPHALYTEVALTETLHLAPTTLQTLREAGRLVPQTIGNVLVYVGADVLTYLRADTITPVVQPNKMRRLCTARISNPDLSGGCDVLAAPQGGTIEPGAEESDNPAEQSAARDCPGEAGGDIQIG
jgi:hypothetical protein